MARWETAARWYEANLCCDLFGAWLVVRTWGGKGSSRHGELTEIVSTERDGLVRIDKLHKERLKRSYLRVS